MTSYAEFSEALDTLSAAEAFEASVAIEAAAGQHMVASSVATMLLNAAVKGGEQRLDQGRVDRAVEVVTKSTVLEVAEFMSLLRKQPRYRVS
ncbi:MAG: hypothetical protein KGQ41_03060 [Alphaproteobacteria bacterium]|nr:hypothetical protein [Alphaproteobacteria bacterium]